MKYQKFRCKQNVPVRLSCNLVGIFLLGNLICALPNTLYLMAPNESLQLRYESGKSLLFPFYRQRN